jgi:hypothetical protein
MSRGILFALLTTGVLSASSPRAQVEVAPAPRAIRPDGTRDPAPRPTAAKKENPLEVVQRIIKNSKTVGDKLAMTDTGSETRQTQEKILKDIQSLIDQQDKPPPSPDKNPDKDPDKEPDKKQKNMDDTKDKKSDDMNKKSDMMPQAGMKDIPPMQKDMGMGGMPSPAGNEDEPHARRPRQQNDSHPEQKNEQPKDPSGGKQQPQPQTKAKNPPPKDPKNTGGVVPDPSKGNPTDPGRPLLPFEDEIVKEVWGHLPDKMRQQATQYYQQDFMPRYTELLKLYYSSLAEKSERK